MQHVEANEEKAPLYALPLQDPLIEAPYYVRLKKTGLLLLFLILLMIALESFLQLVYVRFLS